MPSLQTNDGINLYYATYGDRNAPPLILVSKLQDRHKWLD